MACLASPAYFELFFFRLISVNQLESAHLGSHQIFFGGCYALHHVITYLKEKGIIQDGSDLAKHRLLVVNLQNAGTNMRTEVCHCATGIHVTQLSVHDLNDREGVCAVPVFEKFVVPVIRAALADGAPVYIHCTSGVARAPTLNMALLFELCPQLTFLEALAVVMKSRPVAYSNQGHQHNFREQLRSFYKADEPSTRQRRAADKTAVANGPPAIPALIELPFGQSWIETTEWAPVKTTGETDGLKEPGGRGGRGRGGRGRGGGGGRGGRGARGGGRGVAADVMMPAVQPAVHDVCDVESGTQAPIRSATLSDAPIPIERGIHGGMLCSYKCGGDSATHALRETWCFSQLHSVFGLRDLDEMHRVMERLGASAVLDACRTDRESARSNRVCHRLLSLVVASVKDELRLSFQSFVDDLVSKHSSDVFYADFNAYFSREKISWDWIFRSALQGSDAQPMDPLARLLG